MRLINSLPLLKPKINPHLKNDEFLTALCDNLDIFEAIHRLKLAEQNMDLAAIYTIHGFVAVC